MTVADFILVSTPISSPKLSIFKLPPGMRIPLLLIHLILLGDTDTSGMWMALSSNKISISLEETKFLIFCICFRYPKCETVNSLLRRESGTDSENMPLSLEMQPIPLFSIPILAYAMAFLFESLIDPFKMIS